MKVVAFGKPESLEVGVKELHADARLVEHFLLHIRHYHRIQAAAIRVEQFLLRLVRTVVDNAPR